MAEPAAYAGLAHKPKPPKKVKDHRKHGISHTHIEHNHDGSHQITHHYIHPQAEPSKHSAGDLEELHDHMEEMLGGKMTKEEEAEEE